MMSAAYREGTRLRLRTALFVWGLLAVVGWVVVLLPAYVLIDQGPGILQAMFGDDEAGTGVARPEGHPGLSPKQIEDLGKIAPAAGSGGNED